MVMLDDVTIILDAKDAKTTPDFVTAYGKRDISNVMLFEKRFPRLAMAVAMLRRYAVIAERDSKCIGFYYRETACADLLLNKIYNYTKSGNDFPHNAAVQFYNDIITYINRTSHKFGSSMVTPCTEDIDMDSIPKLNLPNFSAIANFIGPKEQEDWIKKGIFKHLNYDTRIVDALYHDQSIIFVLGKEKDCEVMIGDIFQNEIVNIMFMTENLEIVDAKTYALI